ncbi:MAG: hypothetical protein AAF633_11340 [Chloroflexota bacterium]
MKLAPFDNRWGDHTPLIMLISPLFWVASFNKNLRTISGYVLN